MSTALIPHRATRGQPTKYRPEICAEMLEYFMSAPQTWTGPVSFIYDIERNGKGRARQEVRTICADMPTFEIFAGSLGITARSLRNWCKDHPEFADAYERCQDVQKSFLIRGL